MQSCSKPDADVSKPIFSNSFAGLKVFDVREADVVYKEADGKVNSHSDDPLTDARASQNLAE